MKLIVGLGNPGKIYRDSRHNLGFSVIKSLAQDYKATPKKDNATLSLNTKVRIGEENLILAMPLTFMNLSGIAVSALVKKYKLDLPSILVVCDDLDLEFTRLKIRPKGSAAGHHGLQSVIDSLGSRDFSRIRIGIGKPPKFIDGAEYVLSPFTRKEKGQIEEIIEKAADCCRVWATEGVEKAMSIFNRGPALPNGGRAKFRKGRAG